MSFYVVRKHPWYTTYLTKLNNQIKRENIKPERDSLAMDTFIISGKNMWKITGGFNRLNVLIKDHRFCY